MPSISSFFDSSIAQHPDLTLRFRCVSLQSNKTLQHKISTERKHQARLPGLQQRLRVHRAGFRVSGYLLHRKSATTTPQVRHAHGPQRRRSLATYQAKAGGFIFLFRLRNMALRVSETQQSCHYRSGGRLRDIMERVEDTARGYS